MSIAMYSDCLQCQLRRNLELVRPLGTEAQTMAFARDLMRIYLEAPPEVSSPWFTPLTAKLLNQHYGLPMDRMAKEKAESNAFVLSQMQQLRDRVLAAEDPVQRGLQLAILGNYLDFSALQGRISFSEFDAMLAKAEQMDLSGSAYDCLMKELERGGKLLYLTDNAGEIGFDRIFAETLADRFPQLHITFCVRGGPTLNDATREDAAVMGIPFPVIDNGNLVPGTELRLLSDEARQALEQSDIIFAKGMANAETLLGSGYNIYYAFLVKCARFAKLTGRPLMTPMLVREWERSQWT